MILVATQDSKRARLQTCSVCTQPLLTPCCLDLRFDANQCSCKNSAQSKALCVIDGGLQTILQAGFVLRRTHPC